MTKKRLAIILALLTLMAVLAGAAQAGTIALVSYAGNTSQVYKGKPSPSVAIDIDRTNHAVHYFGIAYKCAATGKMWITKATLSVRHGKIDAHGNFKYTVARGTSHLSCISGHVTARKITGKFAALQLGCKATGTYTATPQEGRAAEPTLTATLRADRHAGWQCAY
jgi:hypothetical protein